MAGAPRYVKLKRVHGKVVDHDVYIGGAVNNPNWKVDRSKWDNTFYSRHESIKSCLEKYEDYVLKTPRLRDSLHELKGKTLACWCAEEKSCHFSVLAKLIRKLNLLTPVNVFKTKRALFFKGSKSILSNLYPCKLEAHGKTFTCSLQLFLYLRSTFIGEFFHAAQILKANTTEAIMKMSTISHVKISYKQSVILMLEALKVKWEQVPQFQATCVINRKLDFLEATATGFYGCGTDILDVYPDRKFAHENVSGMNLLGWMIKYTHLEQSKEMYPEGIPELCVRARKHKSDGKKFYSGLNFLLRVVDQI